ncbi:MAG: hypothetical protein EPO68_17995, partial [Planctomycetota bacterium]
MQRELDPNARGHVGGPADVERLAAALRANGFERFDVALVLGSGLGAFAERLEGAHGVAFDALDGMPTSAVPGH